MARLELEFVGFNNNDCFITVDGKYVKMKKNKTGSYTYNCETNNSKSEILIYKGHYYQTKRWVWWNLLYFIISLFGILDMWQNSKCLVLEAKFNVSTEQDASVVVQRQKFEDGGKFVDMVTQASIEEVSNIQYYDKTAQLKVKKMKKIKLFTAMTIIILTTILIFVL